jgi:DNA-binding transcriptional LysR family regulator
LLRRVAQGVELTSAGREFLDKARVAVEAVDAALAVGEGEQPHGLLVVGLPVPGGRQRWYALTRAFAERYPAVEVEVHETLSLHLQRQVVERQIDCALLFAPRRAEGLTYTRALDAPLSVWMHPDHALASCAELTLADLHDIEVTVVGGSAGRTVGYNDAIHALFAGTRVEPRFVATDEIYPPNAARTPGHLSLMVATDYPEGTVCVPLVPARTLPFDVVRRAETSRSAVRAFARFAAEHLSP